MKVTLIAVNAIWLACGVISSPVSDKLNMESKMPNVEKGAMRGHENSMKVSNNDTKSNKSVVESDDDTSYDVDYSDSDVSSENMMNTNLATLNTAPYSVAGAADHVSQEPRRRSLGFGNSEKLTHWAKEIEKTTLAAITLGSPKVMSLYIILISLLTVIPFGWFTFAGQAAPLNKYYQGVATSFGAQVVVLSLLDSAGLPEWIVTGAALLIFLGGMYYCTKEELECNCHLALDCWFGIILLNFCLVLASPFIVLNNQLVYWLLLGSLSFLLTFAYPMIPYEKAKVNGLQIAVISSYGLISSLVVLFSLFGVGGSLDFYSFFSVPSTFSFSSANIGYLLLMIASVSFGTYINGLRDEKLRA